MSKTELALPKSNHNVLEPSTLFEGVCFKSRVEGKTDDLEDVRSHSGRRGGGGGVLACSPFFQRSVWFRQEFCIQSFSTGYIAGA